MQVKMEQRGDIKVVHVSGKLSLERNQFFREACLKALSNEKVIFCLRDLEFVGSSGIQVFFRTLSDLRQTTSSEVILTDVSTDFRRLLDYIALPGLDIKPCLEAAVSLSGSLEFLSSNPR